jgi:hypothetical protein
METHVLAIGDSPLYEHYKSPPQHPMQEGFVDLSAPIDRHGVRYMPLLRKSLDLTCSMDILFLRQEEAGSLRKRDGDLDNRIKTFFDALEMPPEDGELDGDETDELNYRLFENDTLLRGFNIDSDRLLFPEETYPSHIHLIAQVTIHVETVGPWNISLL